MKSLILAFALSGLLSANAFASGRCTDLEVIASAAEKVFHKRDQASASPRDVEYSGKTKTGKDKWVVTVSIDEECLTGVIVYTREGTCKVTSALEFGQRDCG